MMQGLSRKKMSPDGAQRVQPSGSAAEEEAHFSGAGVPDSDGIDLHNYWRAIKKRQWQILVFFCVVVATVACGAMTMPAVYTATATVLVEPKTPDVIDIQKVLSQEQFEKDYLATQASILRSRALVAHVIQAVDIKKYAFFQNNPPSFLDQVRGRVRKPVQDSIEDSSEESAPEQLTLGVPSRLIDAYLGAVEIEPMGKTNLIEIAVSTSDPELSALLANAHAEAYIRQGLQFRTKASADASRFLEANRMELQARLEKAKIALNQYRQEKQILTLDSQDDMLAERLADLNARLTAAEAERASLEAQVGLVRSRSYDAIPEVGQSLLVQRLKGDLSVLEAEVADRATQFTGQHPHLIQLRAKVNTTKVSLNHELQKIANRLESAYLAAKAQEDAVRAKLDEQKGKAFTQNNDSVQDALLVREVETSSQLYDNVLQRMKEVALEAEVQASNVFIIDQAEVPRSAARPNRKMIVLLGACLGLIGGVGLAFFFEFLDNTLKTPEEVERLLQLPNLGTVPDFQGMSSQRSGGTGNPILSGLTALGSLFSNGDSWGNRPRHTSHGSSHNSWSQRQTSASHRELSSRVVEAYRTLHTAIQLSQTEDPLHTLLFTSGKPGEGKTTTVINTAIHFAQMGARVLVIDADLRRPSCHRGLKLDKGLGLSELLTGQRELSEVIRNASTRTGRRGHGRNTAANLFFLSSGSTPPNPTKLLGSHNMRELLHSLRQSYDYILIDSPPVIPVSDARLLSTLVDGVVLVVDGQKTPKAVAREACARLRHAHSKLLGVVLNRMDPRNGSYEDFSYPAYVEPEYA